jgi:hypothetical protein
MSAGECRRRAVAALGRNEDFILAETVGNAVFAHNEQTAVVVYTTPAKDGICVYVVAAGRDVKETGRLWVDLLNRICGAPPVGNVPDWIATTRPGRQSRAPILRLDIEMCRLTLMQFTDAAVAALRRQGFRLDVGTARDCVLGFKHNSIAGVAYEPQSDGRGCLSVVTGAIDPREAERLRKEIQADILVGQEGTATRRGNTDK